MAANVVAMPVYSPSQSRLGRKGMLRYTTRPPVGAPEFEMVKGLGDIHEVVIAIEQDHTTTDSPISPPTEVCTAPSQGPTAPSFRLQAPTPPLAEGPTTPISLTVPCPSTTSPLPSRSASPTSIESKSCSDTTSPTLVRKASTASTGTYSPVMRSMFPRYDPTVSLGQQRYCPQGNVNPALAASATRIDEPRSYSPSPCTQQEPSLYQEDAGLPKGLGLQKVGELSKASDSTPHFSTPDELVDLWALANGQTSTQAAKEYRLELSCDDLEAGQEIICLDSATSQSLYSLSATNNELSISRSHPQNDMTTIQVSAPTLQTSSSSSPLIATIFPKLAELMAIDKSSSVAVEQRLDRKDSTTAQTAAVERAHRQEASSLLWDSESQKYYLIHPSLLDDGSPAAFPIEVSLNAGTPQEIKVLAPNSDNNAPLLELSFDTLHLDIHVEAVTSYTSLYLLDTLLSATLVLLLHLHRSRCPPSSLRPTTSPATSAIPYFEPPPTFASPLHSKPSKKDKRLTSWSKSFFTRPIAQKNKRQRADDEESVTGTTVQGSSLDLSVTAKLPHPPSNTFQIIDPADEKLPRTTRAVLKVLYWGFECLFWALGMLVNVLAMLVVGLGKLVKVL